MKRLGIRDAPSRPLRGIPVQTSKMGKFRDRSPQIIPDANENPLMLLRRELRQSHRQICSRNSGDRQSRADFACNPPAQIRRCRRGKNGKPGQGDACHAVFDAVEEGDSRFIAHAAALHIRQ